MKIKVHKVVDSSKLIYLAPSPEPTLTSGYSHLSDIIVTVVNLSRITQFWCDFSLIALPDTFTMLGKNTEAVNLKARGNLPHRGEGLIWKPFLKVYQYG
ncbi:hypothetical protein ACFLV4_04935 [Chloroflexota bacterium]